MRVDPRTRMLPLLYSMAGGKKQAKHVLQEVSNERSWLREVGIDAVDNRVFYTLEGDHAELWFRMNEDEEDPLLAGT